MSKTYVVIYDGVSRDRLAYLQNAHDITYEKSATEVWTGSFNLPKSDYKRVYCQPLNYAELWEKNNLGGTSYVGLFRIQPITEDLVKSDTTVTYQLEHAITTLLDDTIVGWFQSGGVDVPTKTVISDILSKQTVARWVVHDVDFDLKFTYGLENENVLSALFSIVKPFPDFNYYWDFETQGFPWGVSLKKVDPDEPVTDVRYRKNVVGWKRVVDPRNIVTRIYPYGYGFGDNRLNVKEVNNDKEYIDSPNIEEYGAPISTIWVDQTIKDATALLNAAKSLLAKIDKPKVTHNVSLEELNLVEPLKIGDTVRVVHSGTVDEVMVVRGIKKNDVSGKPKSGLLTLGDASVENVSDAVSQIADRQRISELYSQGAESMFIDSFADNADPDHPLTITFIIPETAVHVNSVQLTFRLEAFRAYSKAAKDDGRVEQTSEDGGAIIKSSGEGGSITKTSEAGEGEIETNVDEGTTNITTTMDGGEIIESDEISTGDGGLWGHTTEDGQLKQDTTEYINQTYLDASFGDAIYDSSQRHESPATPVRWGNDPASFHNHDFNYHTHNFQHKHTIVFPEHKHSFEVPDHTHKITLPDHQHKIKADIKHSHTITLPAHRHTIKLPDHVHKIDLPDHKHMIKIEPHGHELEYGIYEGPKATAVLIFIDGNPKAIESSWDGFEISEFLEKGSNGTSIKRGKHTVVFKPNDLTRISCSLQVRLFTNSRGDSQL